MPLTPGDHLGPYEILGPWGRAGWARSIGRGIRRLNRDVAIKVLPAGLGNDADYLTERAKFTPKSRL